MGNPDIRPEQTVQYQFGYKQAVTEWLGVDLNLFYKDIRDLLGVEFISTYNDAEYARLTNVDFGNVIGFTVALEQRRRGLVSTALDYTWQLAQGNSSDPRETATRAEAGEDPRPRQVPFNWDQRHTLNLTVMLSRPDDFSAERHRARGERAALHARDRGGLRRQPRDELGAQADRAARGPARGEEPARGRAGRERVRARVQPVRLEVLQRLRVRQLRAAPTTRASRARTGCSWRTPPATTARGASRSVSPLDTGG